MASAPPATEIRTMADLLQRLGGISLQRIRFNPPPGTAKKQDVINADRMGEAPCELIDGVLVDKAMGFKEGVIAGTIVRLLGNFVLTHNLGVVAGADATLQLWEALVRIPDVAFISWDRLPGGVPDEPIPELVPELAVEVLCRSNTPGEMQRKRSEYFQAGVRLVWVVDPPTRTVRVYTNAEEFAELSGNDSLDGGDVLPGFKITVRDIFAELDRTSEA